MVAARWLILLLALAGGVAGHTFAVEVVVEPGVLRRQALVRMVRQDCGSCHGLTLNGGIGPPLTVAALEQQSQESLTATILHGRPGTPMPPFLGLLEEQEVRWIVRQLLAGFPEEH